MPALDYRTAGESHGPALTVLVEGMPAGVPIDAAFINSELARRQGGHGRSARQRIEHDVIQLLAGARRGRTTGGPVVMQIGNRDARLETAPPIHHPRPGHADFAGAMKWLTTDCRETLERASARETAPRVAAGALARCLLRELGIDAVGFVTRIGRVAWEAAGDAEPDRLRAHRDASGVYCPDPGASGEMIEAITAAQRSRDTLGGVVEVRVYNVPPGLGSCARWQDKLDGRIMAAVGSIQAIKAVEIGLGVAAGAAPGTAVHDAMEYSAERRGTPCVGFIRRTNNAGGLEGGMTNGMPVVVRAAMKPLSTVPGGLDSVDLQTLQPHRGDVERSDVCAVPAASVVAENVVAFEIARAVVDKFGGDTLREVRAAYDYYLAALRDLPRCG